MTEQPKLCVVCKKPLVFPSADDPYTIGARFITSLCRHSVRDRTSIMSDPAEMTSKQRVLAAYPDAAWAKNCGAIYDDGDPSRNRISGDTWWNLEESAWDDAAALIDARAQVTR